MEIKDILCASQNNCRSPISDQTKTQYEQVKFYRADHLYFEAYNIAWYVIVLWKHLYILRQNPHCLSTFKVFLRDTLSKTMHKSKNVFPPQLWQQYCNVVHMMSSRFSRKLLPMWSSTFTYKLLSILGMQASSSIVG